MRERQPGQSQPYEAIEVSKRSSAYDLLVLEYKADGHGAGRMELYRNEGRYSLLPTSWTRLRNADHLKRFSRMETRIQVAKAWLKECESHRCLQQKALRFHLPTRVIDITGLEDQHVFLRRNDGILEGRYICLSYCWGGKDFLRLSKGNQLDLEHGIELNQLPTLFFDFVHMASAFGVRYVWIDSLCIIQDDFEDWEKEAKQMNLVYGNAYLTIAASAAPDPTYHLYYKQHHQAERPEQLLGGLYMRKRRHPTGLPDTNNMTGETCNWSKRGWTFQEYLLSSRVLHLTDRELVWHCNQELKCECRKPVPLLGKKMLPYGHPRQQFQAASDPNASLQTKIEAWHVCAGEHSKRSLTKLTDYDVAISGVAEAFQKIMQCPYHAGSWTDLWADLCWWRAPRGKESETQVVSERIQLAPSWSWLATGQPVEFKKGISIDYHGSSPDWAPCGKLFTFYPPENSTTSATGCSSISTWGIKLQLSCDSKANIYLHPSTLNDLRDFLEPQNYAVAVGTLDWDPTEEEQHHGIRALCLLVHASPHTHRPASWRSASMMVIKEAGFVRNPVIPVTSTFFKPLPSSSPSSSLFKRLTKRSKQRDQLQPQTEVPRLGPQPTPDPGFVIPAHKRIGFLSAIDMDFAWIDKRMKKGQWYII